MEYVPPFTVSAEAINLIAEISRLVERFVIRMEQEDALRLRKVNRIKTIHSSLAIEGNTLTEGEVRDVIEGKTVVAPIREIQEVKNAIETYALYPNLDPFEVKDLLKAHGTMMKALTDDAGKFRRGGVGVFSGSKCVHLAPPADRVPTLIADLFGWLKKSRDHLLIRSCVFHYEFEFIHPFTDGNGRTGRLWQSLILGRLNPVFEHLPVENMVYANQQAYYDAIGRSSALADCGPFIDFMLGEIYKTLKAHRGDELAGAEKEGVGNAGGEKWPKKWPKKWPDIAEGIMRLIAEEPRVSIGEMEKKLGVGHTTLKKIIVEMQAAGVIERIGTARGGEWRAI